MPSARLALEDRPELLSAAGAEEPVPSVLRLIDRLCEAGAADIARSGCARCGRVIALVKPRGGLRLCHSCVGKSQAEACAPCRVDERLRELLGDSAGVIAPRHRSLYEALATTERPATAAAWLDQSGAPAILHGLEGDGELTHEVLDAMGEAKAVEHLRAVLAAIGTLEARDEQMARPGPFQRNRVLQCRT